MTVFEEIGEIQWAGKPDLPPIKKPGFHLFPQNSVQPESRPAANDNSKRLNLISWFCSQFCRCCIFKSPGFVDKMYFAPKNCLIFVFYFTETQRDIIANDTVHNNRFDYAVSVDPDLELSI